MQLGPSFISIFASLVIFSHQRKSYGTLIFYSAITKRQASFLIDGVCSGCNSRILPQPQLLNVTDGRRMLCHIIKFINSIPDLVLGTEQ